MLHEWCGALGTRALEAWLSVVEACATTVGRDATEDECEDEGVWTARGNCLLLWKNEKASDDGSSSPGRFLLWPTCGESED